MPPQCPHPGGWTTAEAAARLAADGPNELPATRPLGYWRLLAEIVPLFLMLCLEVGAWGANRCWRAASRPSNCWGRRRCRASIKQAP